MAQFGVYRNLRGSNEYAPYLVDVQCDLLALETRAVIPLASEDYFGTRINRLNPVFTIESRQLVLATSEIVAIVTHDLKHPIADLSAFRDEIIGAIDFLFTGV